MFIQVIIAVVVGVVFGGLLAGYQAEPQTAFLPDVITLAAFVLATLVTAVAGKLFSGAGATSTSKPRAKAAKPAQSNGASGPREEGEVKWFNVSKGFGFITRDNGEDIFVHYRSIRGQGRRRLFDGQAVAYSVSQGDKGLQADDVEVLS